MKLHNRASYCSICLHWQSYFVNYPLAISYPHKTLGPKVQFTAVSDAQCKHQLLSIVLFKISFYNKIINVQQLLFCQCLSLIFQSSSLDWLYEATQEQYCTTFHVTNEEQERMVCVEHRLQTHHFYSNSSSCCSFGAFFIYLHKGFVNHV